MQRGWPTQDIGDAVSSGDLDSLMAWFRETEGPRFTETGAPTPWNVNFTVERETVGGGTTVFPLLALAALGETESGKNTTAGHVAVARELISRGADATLEVTVTIPSTLISSIKILGGLVGLSGRVLGDDHPLKRKIVASFLKCFDEQLDWSLDDIPDDYLEYRALLLEGGCAAARRRGVR